MNQQIAPLILEYRKAHPYKTSTFTRSQEANKLNDENPFAFLLCATVDRMSIAEVVWSTAFELRKALGHLDPTTIAAMNPEDIEPLLPEGLYLRRDSARTIVDCANQVVSRWRGDASRIWATTDVREILARLDDIFGVGRAIASMIINILIRDGKLELPPDQLARVDVKPDTHIRRVFFRTGLSEKESEKAAIDAGRKANPRYPGELDMPAWQIGREYCDPGLPHCGKCPLEKACSKRGLHS